MKTLIISPDSFKGSLSAPAAAAALERGAQRALGKACRCLLVPLADGGEGTVAALLGGAGGQKRTQTVRGPLGQNTAAQWAILQNGSGVVEMAQASGLTLVPAPQRDALRASSYGTGQLIRAALDAECREILIAIGGSATTDGGAGALQALGARFTNKHGADLPPGGAALGELAEIDLTNLDARLLQTRLTVLCDVSNPLHGPRGAAHIYGPQKGASPGDVQLLDAALAHLADCTAQTLGRDLREAPGAGAAGGIGFGLMSFLGATLRPGIEAVLEAADFAAKLESADLVLTGEGSLDEQTLCGKAVAGVARAARTAKNGQGVPVIAFGGAVHLSGAQLDELGLLSAFALPNAPLNLDQCLENAAPLLESAAERALRLWRY